MVFTDDFIRAYPTPWRIDDREVVDADGCNVQDFAANTPEDREFWQCIVNAVNGAAARQLIDDEDLLRLGEKLVEMAQQARAADVFDFGARAIWHFEIDDDRYRVAVVVAGGAA